MNQTWAKAFAIASAALALASCGQARGQHWQEVNEFDAPSAQIHLVVVEPAFDRDTHIYDDAAATLCPSDGCSIEFFETMNAIPKATSFADYRDGGYSTNALVRFGRKTFFAANGFVWNCDRFPQQFLNSCIVGTDPVPTNSAAAQRRGPLEGFRKVKFGMPLRRIVSVLGGADAVSITGAEGSENVHGKTNFQGQTYVAVYGIQKSRLDSMLFSWSMSLERSACLKEVNNTAEGLQRNYGKEDGLNYFIAGGDLVEYKWYFANGGRVSMSNVGMTDDSCVIYINFDTKANLDEMDRLHPTVEQ